MLHKSFELLETKADGDTGEFTALVSVFGNVDSVGDRIMPGAYTKTLEKWRQSGDPIPIILSHQWSDAMSHVGIANPNDVVETEKGLHVKGQLDVADNPVAKQVHKLLKRRSLKEFSIGYQVPKGGEKRAKDGANEITQIDLVEAGPTLKGANSATELHEVKSAVEAESATAENLLAAVKETLETAKKNHELFVSAGLDLVKEVKQMLGVEQEPEVDATGGQPDKADSVDPLLELSRRTVQEIRTDGLGERKSPSPTKQEQQDPPSQAELRDRSREVMLSLLKET